MTTTENSRADALMDEQIKTIWDRECGSYTVWEEWDIPGFVRACIAASPVEQPAAAPIDLQGLRSLILTPREIVRDQDGMLSHPAVPYLDEDVNYETFFAAFGIEAAFIHMEDDVDCDTYDRYFASNSPDCSMWTPSIPRGDGWLLLKIYDTEDGPVALHVRPFPPKQSRRRAQQVSRTPAEQASFDEGVEEGKRQMAVAVMGGMRHD